MSKMKCQTNKQYIFTKGLFKGKIVVPFDGEPEGLAPHIHGFTCFRDSETGEYLGWCGTYYFEENTNEIYTS